jgi:hypothetical protein
LSVLVTQLQNFSQMLALSRLCSTVVMTNNDGEIKVYKVCGNISVP